MNSVKENVPFTFLILNKQNFFRKPIPNFKQYVIQSELNCMHDSEFKLKTKTIDFDDLENEYIL